MTSKDEKEVYRGQFTVDRREIIEDQELLKELVMLTHCKGKIYITLFLILK